MSRKQDVKDQVLSFRDRTGRMPTVAELADVFHSLPTPIVVSNRDLYDGLQLANDSLVGIEGNLTNKQLSNLAREVISLVVDKVKLSPSPQNLPSDQVSLIAIDEINKTFSAYNELMRTQIEALKRNHELLHKAHDSVDVSGVTYAISELDLNIQSLQEAVEHLSKSVTSIISVE